MESERHLQDNRPELKNQEYFLLLKRIALASEAPAEILAIVAECDCTEMLELVASHGNCAPVLIDQLARHPHSEIRIAAAENRSTSEETLLALVKDDSVDVRYALAENHNLPETVLERLVDDENPYVAHRALKTLSRLRQPGMTGKLLRWLGINNQERHGNLP